MTDSNERFQLLPTKPHPLLIAVWGFLAALNLSAGAVIATWPERQADLETMTRWGRDWLVLGLNVYGPVEDDPVDYPPHAIVALSLLALVPDGWRIPVWAGFNLLLAIVAPYLALRAVHPTLTRMGAALPVLMLLCWGGFRALLQLSLLALVFGLLAMVLADRRPRLSGWCLGMALMKPQMSAPIFLWALFTRRFQIAGWSIAVVVLGFTLVCARAGVAPVTVVRTYVQTLTEFYTGEAIMIGLAQLRPLFALAVRSPVLIDFFSGVAALSLLVLVCVFGVRERRSNRAVLYSAPGLAGIWSLLTFYHLTYGFILLLPLAALLLLDDSSTTFSLRRRIFWLMQIALMFDVPGLWWRFGSLTGASATVSQLTIHVDRLVMLGLFAAVATLARRTSSRALHKMEVLRTL
jgi:hypothetical protein